MPICECGFNFAKANLKGQRFESYAVIRDDDYPKVMRKESAILSEHGRDKVLALISDAAQWVGSLMRCPKCGAWVFVKPHGRTRDAIVILKAVPPVKRARPTKRRASANASRHATSTRHR